MCTATKETAKTRLPEDETLTKAAGEPEQEDAPRAHDDEYDEEWEVWCGGEC